MAFCVNCGKEVASEARFCGVCGTATELGGNASSPAVHNSEYKAASKLNWGWGIMAVVGGCILPFAVIVDIFFLGGSGVARARTTPQNSGYIRDSRQAAAENAAGSFATFLGVAAQVDATVTCVASERICRIGTGSGTHGRGIQVAIPNGFGVTFGEGTVTIAHCIHTTATATRTYGTAKVAGVPSGTTGC